MDSQPFYGFGNYLTDNGETLGSAMIFVFAEDKKAARGTLVQELSRSGDLVPGSLRVCAGNTIHASWLLAAAMQSEEADWSSGVAMPTAFAHRKEMLN